MTRLVGRQPIFDRNMQVFGYELLFRPIQPGEPFDDDFATASVLNNALMGMTLPQLVGDARAFVNFPTSFFMQVRQPPFGPEQLVIEVLERVPPEDAIVDALGRLKTQGYTLALDDFIFSREFVPFLKLADIVKVEVNENRQEKLPQLVDKIRRVTGARLLAEKVETHDLHRFCHELGFDYFQGYFYARPDVVETRDL